MKKTIKFVTAMTVMLCLMFVFSTDVNAQAKRAGSSNITNVDLSKKQGQALSVEALDELQQNPSIGNERNLSNISIVHENEVHITRLNPSTNAVMESGKVSNSANNSQTNGGDLSSQTIVHDTEINATKLGLPSDKTLKENKQGSVPNAKALEELGQNPAKPNVRDLSTKSIVHENEVQVTKLGSKNNAVLSEGKTSSSVTNSNNASYTDGNTTTKPSTYVSGKRVINSLNSNLPAKANSKKLQNRVLKTTR